MATIPRKPKRDRQHSAVFSKSPKKPGPMADKEVVRWMDRLKAGLDRREEEEKIWSANRMYENMGQWDPESKKDKARINKIGSWVMNRMAALTFRRPEAHLVPRSIDGHEFIDVQTGARNPDGSPVVMRANRAMVTEAVLNKVASSSSFGQARKFRRYCRHGLMSIGVMKVGYEPIFEDNGDGPEQAIDELTGQPLFDVDGEPIMDSADPIEERWFMDVVRPERCIIDPNGENEFRDHEWFCEIQVRDLEDVKSDQLLKNTGDLEPTIKEYWKEDNLDSETEPAAVGHMMVDHGGAGVTERVKLYEIWDLKNERLIVLADGHDKILRDDPAPEGIDHSPYVFFRPQEIDDEFYQRPPATDLLPLNKEYDLWRTMKMRQMRKNTRKMMMLRRAASPEVLAALRSEEDNEIAVVDGVMRLSDAITPVPYPQGDGQDFAHGPIVINDFDEIGGVSGTRRGNTAHRTATQTNAAEMGNTMREDFLREIYAESLREIYKKLLDSIQGAASLDIAVELVGEQGQAFYGYVNHKDIIGDYDVSVDVREMVPSDSDLKRQQLVSVIQIIAGAPWLVADEVAAAELFETFGIINSPLASAIAQQAQQAQQEQQQQQPQVTAQGNVADAISAQMGGAMGGF